MGSFNRPKFKALVHYICARCQDNPARLGSVKLNNILWYADTGHFLKSGEPLTGARYVKRQRGPVPAAIMPIVEELVQEGKVIVRDPVSQYDTRQYITLQEPEIDPLFSASDIRDIDNIIDAVCDSHTAKSISDRTHNEAWLMAEMGEDLPYYTVLARPGEITEDDVAWADERIAALAS
jgi:hypothetical protein